VLIYLHQIVFDFFWDEASWVHKANATYSGLVETSFVTEKSKKEHKND